MAETVGAIVLGVVFDVGPGLAIFGIASTTLATAVGGAILIGGSIGLQLLLNKSKPNAQPGDPALPAPEAGHQPIKQAIPPRIVGYGRVRLSGSYVLFEASSGVSYDVLAIHHGRIGGIIGYYLHDDVVTIDPITGIVDVQGDGRYNNNAIKIKTRLGLATETAYTEISTPLSAIWGASYRGDGIASLAMICSQQATPTIYANVYPRGLPVPSIVADCAPVFDPRDGAQSRGSPLTWLVSSNPVLQMIDFLTNADRGMGFDYATLITPRLTQLMAQADLCDALVVRKDGANELRYASNGSFPLDSDPADIVSSVLDTCDGWLSQNGDGSLSLIVGQYIAPTVTLESKHIRGYTLQYGLAEEEVVNELTLDYTEPQADYKTSPGAPWRNEQDISDRGKVRSQRLALPWVYSHSQARRLAKRRDAQNNAGLRGVLTTTLYGIRCLGERWVRITAPDASDDLASVVIEVRGLTIDLLNASCQIKFVSVNPNAIDAWDPATEEGAAPAIPAKLVFPPPGVPQNILAVPGTSTFSLMDVSCDDPGRSDLTYQAQWRINGSVGAFTQGPSRQAPFTDSSGRPAIRVTSGVSFGTTYEVQMRAFAPAGVPSAFSASTTAVL